MNVMQWLMRFIILTNYDLKMHFYFLFLSYLFGWTQFFFKYIFYFKIFNKFKFTKSVQTLPCLNPSQVK